METKTARANVDGISQYATPLLRVENMPQFHALKEAMLANLHSTERQPSTFWPTQPVTPETEDSVELWKSSICCFIVTAQNTLLSDADQFSSFKLSQRLLQKPIMGQWPTKPVFLLKSIRKQRETF